jgi:hypothetical protein
MDAVGMIGTRALQRADAVQERRLVVVAMSIDRRNALRRRA